MFIATLLTIAKIWNLPRCPSTDEWIKKLVYYTMEYYSAIKKMKCVTYRKMDGARDHHVKQNKTD
jgi:hypothetical protein